MPVQECLSPEALRDYALGKLPDDVSQQVADHLAECWDCENTVASLDAASDTVVGFLKMSRRESPFTNEAGYQRALRSVQPLDQPEAAAAELDQQASANDAASRQHSEDGAEPSITDDGAVVRDYRLVEKLGEGGMGAVFKAIHTKLNRVVALKVLSAHRMRDRDAVARFEREMKAVGQLDHPAIVRATDAGEIDGTWFLAMEFIDGLNLAQLSDANGPLPIADACELVCQAAIGLQYVHEQGMVHRDIKPSNLILAGVGDNHTEEKSQDAAGSVRRPSSATVKILDLGLALVGGLHGTVDELTTVGQLMGTLDYMAPEQGDDSHDVDIRADIYSVGATLYKLLAGRAPYSGPKLKSPLQKLKALATEDVSPIRDHRADVPEELAEIVHRMLARHPDQRYATPAEVAESLQPFAEGARLDNLLQQTRDRIATSESAAALSQDVSRLLPQPLPASSSGQAGGQQSAPARSGVRRLVKAAAGLLAAAAIVLAGSTIYLKTGSGELILESDQPDIEVIVKRSGKFYEDLQVTHTPFSTSIAAGSYEVELKGETDGLRIEGNRFTLLRNGIQVVRITRSRTIPPEDSTLSSLHADLAAERIKLDVARRDYGPKHPTIVELEDTIRSYEQQIARHKHEGSLTDAAAAKRDEVRYDGKTYHEWMNELQMERSTTRLKTALDSLVAIGKTDHQLEVARAILDVMRRGSYVEIQARGASNEDRALHHAGWRGFATLGLPAADAISLLAEELQNGSSSGRYFALDTIAYLLAGPHPIEGQSAIPALLAASKDRNAFVRSHALEVLVQVGGKDKRTVTRLREALQDEEIGVRPVMLTAAALLTPIDPKAEGLAAALLKTARLQPPDLTLVTEAVGHLRDVAVVRPETNDEIVRLLIEFIEGKSQLLETRVASGGRMISVPAPRDIDLRRFSLTTLADYGPLAQVAIPAIEKQFDVPDNKELHGLAEKALERITGKRQPERYKGKTLRQWCDVFRLSTDESERFQVLLNLGRFSRIRLSPSTLQPEEARMIAEAVLAGMRDYDWPTSQEPPAWELKESAARLLERLSKAELPPPLIAELTGDSRNGKLFVLAFFFKMERLGASSPLRGWLTPPLLKALLAAMGDEDSAVRNGVLRLLHDQQLGRDSFIGIREDIVSALRQRLDDESGYATILAAMMLCRDFGDQESVASHVIDLLGNADMEKKRRAIIMMSGLKPETVVPLLVEILRDESPELRMPTEASTLEPPWYLGILWPKSDTSLPWPTSHPTVLGGAIRALEMMGRAAKDTEAVAALRDLAQGQDPAYSALAAAALRTINPPVKESPKPTALYDGQTFDEWKNQLTEKKPERLAQVLTALGILAADDEERAREAASLILGVAHQHWTDISLGISGSAAVRGAAVDAYRRVLFSPVAVKRLSDEVENGDSNWLWFRLYVLNGTTASSEVIPLPDNLDRKTAVEGLIAASKDADSSLIGPAIQCAAGLTIPLKLNDDRLKARVIELLHHADPATVDVSVRILAKIDPEADGFVDRLIELTKHKEPNLRVQAIYELGRLGPKAKKAAPALVDLLKSRGPELAEAGSIGSSYCDKSIDSASWVGLGASVSITTTRRAAIETLGRLGEVAKEAVPVLEELLRAGIEMNDEMPDQELDDKYRTPPDSKVPACSLADVVAIFEALAQMGPTAQKTLDLMQLRYDQAKQYNLQPTAFHERMQAAIDKVRGGSQK